MAAPFRVSQMSPQINGSKWWIDLLGFVLMLLPALLMPPIGKLIVVGFALLWGGAMLWVRCFEDDWLGYVCPCGRPECRDEQRRRLWDG